MDVRKVLSLRGPNIWAVFPVLEAWVDLGPLADLAPVQLPGFDQWLREWFPAPIASPGSWDSSPAGLRRGASLAHVLERLTVRLQCLAGTEVSFGLTRETAQPGVYQVACAYEDEELGRSALALARELCLAAVQGQRRDASAEVAKLRDLVQRLRKTALEEAVTRAAHRRDVPVRVLPGGIVLLGQGARQRRILGTRTDRTSAVGEAIASDRGLTRNMLTAVGVPVADADADRHWRLVVVGAEVVAAQGPDPDDDLAALVHPDVAERAVEAAGVVGLDVAGVVLAAQDVGQPLQAEDGVVTVEANPVVEEGDAEFVGEALVAGLFPVGEDGRIPVVAVTGVNGKTTTTRLIAHILTQSLGCVGMTCTEGIYVGAERIELGDCSGPRSAETVLQHPDVEAAVLETARGGILRSGLGYDQCDVAVVTNVGEGDHLGCGGVETLEELARVKRVIIEAVRPGGTAVLNAEDPLVVAMRDHTPGTVTFFARSPSYPVIVAHRAAGGRAVFVRKGRIVLARGAREKVLASLGEVPLTGNGRIGFQIENVLAAVAATWALHVPLRAMRSALRSFDSDVEHTPARFNLLEVNGAVAVLDYGHNTSALAALLETLDQFPPTHRTVVFSAAGDRRDSDLIRQGELLGDAFDRVILYEDGNCTRGRVPGEIIGLFHRGLAGRLRVSHVQEVRGAVRAVELALTTARPGELLLVQVDVVEDTLELVRGYLAGAEVRQITLEEALACLAVLPVEPVAATGGSPRALKRQPLRPAQRTTSTP
jgi:cyanophycin synthetase